MLLRLGLASPELLWKSCRVLEVHGHRILLIIIVSGVFLSF